MLSQTAVERYLEIQNQILDKKIENLKSRSKYIQTGMSKDFRLKALKLERKKNRLTAQYKKIKNSGIKNYDSLLNKINSELQEICKLYNRLFSQLESSQ